MYRQFFSRLFIPILFIGFSIMAQAQPVSLKTKIGQMLLIGFQEAELTPTSSITQAILSQQIGGVILFDYNFQLKNHDHNIKNPAQLQKLTQQLQHYAKQADINHHNHLTPLFIGIDYEGGFVNRLKESYGFPKTLSAADIGQGSDEQALRYAEQMANTLNTMGININFAPVVDVNINPNNPVIGKLNRSFSSDPDIVTHYAAIFSRVFQAHGIACAYKHFPGHGSSTGDSHEGFVDVTKTWKSLELIPYQKLFHTSSRCPMIMSAHVVHTGLDKKGYPASLSFAMSTELLRNTLKYDGIVITDDLQMKAITDHYSIAEAVELAIHAGADILVFGNQLVATPQDPAKIVDIIYQDVLKGKISEERINQSYQRIMALKHKLKKNK